MIPPEQVRQAVQEVLSRPAYDDLRPGLGARALDAVRSVIAEVLATVFGSGAAGLAAQLVVLVIPVALLVAALLALRRLRRGAQVAAVAEQDRGLDRAELLERADRARAAGDHTAAVRARYAVLVSDLEQLGVLDGRPGTTVGEVDRAVARDRPDDLAPVQAAGSALARVVYGAATAGAEDDDAVAEALAALPAPAGRALARVDP